LEHDAQRLPELTAAVKEEVVDLSYRAAARAIASVAPEVADVEAIAIVALGSLVAARRTMWTFGSAPLSISDDRLLRTWAQAAVARASGPGRTEHREDPQQDRGAQRGEAGGQLGGEAVGDGLDQHRAAVRHRQPLLHIDILR